MLSLKGIWARLFTGRAHPTAPTAVPLQQPNVPVAKMEPDFTHLASGQKMKFELHSGKTLIISYPGYDRTKISLEVGSDRGLLCLSYSIIAAGGRKQGRIPLLVGETVTIACSPESWIPIPAGFQAISSKPLWLTCDRIERPFAAWAVDGVTLEVSPGNKNGVFYRAVAGDYLPPPASRILLPYAALPVNYPGVLATLQDDYVELAVRGIPCLIYRQGEELLLRARSVRPVPLPLGQEYYYSVGKSGPNPLSVDIFDLCLLSERADPKGPISFYMWRPMQSRSTEVNLVSATAKLEIPQGGGRGDGRTVRGVTALRRPEDE